MKLDANKLSNAVRLALAMGTVASVGAVGSAYAQSADTTDNKSQNLETIVVTGSNIRRVDIETANPVLTIDHAAIQQSGKLTLGDLVQSLPSIAGAALNPNVNNGGGDGSARISLRGLGTNRSLLLINGHRVPAQLQDLNIIPASAVERIEVLSDGSSAVYGSDAVAGVVNIITRTNYQGAEFGADYGESDHDDGARKSYHAMFGQSTDKGSIILGLNYNKTDAVLAANRAYSHDALYKYNTGYVLHGGSSRTPGGHITLPATSALAKQLGCPVSGGNVNVIRANSNSGATAATPADYRCYKATDAFNYQAVGNYDATPGERTGIFALGNYKLTDSVEAFMEIFHNKTVSRQQIAPVPLDVQTDGIVIPSNAYYNPFGVAFGPGANEFRTRLVSLGNRGTDFSTTHDLATAGFKGSFGDTGWTWFADASYGKKSQQEQFIDYINYSALSANFACATAACSPLNIFNVNNDAAATALLNSAKISPFVHNTYQMKSGEAGVSGSVFALPAGDVQLAVGASYRKEYVDDQVDSLIQTTVDKDLNVFCSGPGSICSSPTQGGFTVKEAYAELFVPLLKDLPFVHSLNLDIGDRYSKYSNFGSTSNWKVALEFKPIEDLLIRGTVSKVFRAPTVSDLFAGPAGDSPTAIDPCSQPSAATNKACPGIVPATGLSQTNGIVAGTQWAKANLGINTPVLPENGKSYDYGFVYDPQWLPGLSVNADYYRIVLNNLIVSGPGTASTILTDCFNSNGASPLCNLIKRNASGSSAGQIQYVFETPFNSGNLETKGADFGVAYRLPETPFGNFRVGLQSTYIQAYTITQDNGQAQQYAGHFDKTFGNFARWRGLGTLDWNWGAFNAQWQARYIGPITVGYVNAGLGPSASADALYDPAGASPYHYGAYVYHNVSFGYNIEPINTQVQVGVDNIANKQPPILYQQNVINANTDVNTYDTIGRFFWGKITVKF